MSEYEFISSWGEHIPVVIDTRRGVRNITLRPKTRPVREIHITKPWLATAASALRFLDQKRKWVERIYAAAPEKSHVRVGDTIEFLGRRVKLVHDASRHANQFIVCADGVCTLIVGGDDDMFERRVRDFIKGEFLSVARAMIKTAPRELWPTRVAVRDTTSRWGSCSSTGTISFSWRLAFAPTDVMRYVIMHELAHRVHMNHSPAFWATVAQLYGDGVGRAKRWLTVHGAELHEYF